MATAVSPKQGGTALEPDPTCKELEGNNIKAREAIIKELTGKPSDADKSALAKAETTGMTVSSASSTVPAAPGASTASSSGIANAHIPNGQATGSSSAQMMGMNKDDRASDDPALDPAKKTAGVLCDQRHVHPGGGYGAHAEAKIVNTMTNTATDASASLRGGSITFNIDWRSSRYGRSGMPCPKCYDMLCKAARECEIKIFICDHQNQPQQIDEDCDQPDKYTDLCVKVDGGSVPGRPAA